MWRECKVRRHANETCFAVCFLFCEALGVVKRVCRTCRQRGRCACENLHWLRFVDGETISSISLLQLVRYCT